MMTVIREVVQQALKTGYLTQKAENELRLMLTTTEYDLEDMNAFMNWPRSRDLSSKSPVS
jgi:hypothetical protein